MTKTLNNRHGIVLKKYFPIKRKIVVLDKEFGKLEYVPMSEDICVGMLLEYRAEPARGGVTFMYNAEKMGLPLLLAQQDILFFHHVLELCYYFLPEGAAVPELFTLLEYLYTSECNTFTTRFKKLFLVKFFAIIGMYPEDSRFQKPFFFRLATVSIDILVQQNLDLGIERDLDAWLRNCILMHPHHEKFKTVHFLEESRLA